MAEVSFDDFNTNTPTAANFVVGYSSTDEGGEKRWTLSQISGLIVPETNIRELGNYGAVPLLSGIVDNSGLWAYGITGVGTVTLVSDTVDDDGYYRISGNGIPGVEAQNMGLSSATTLVSGVFDGSSGIGFYGITGVGTVTLVSDTVDDDGYYRISGSPHPVAPTSIPGIQAENLGGSTIVSGVLNSAENRYSGAFFYGIEGEGTVTLVDDGLAEFGTYRISGSKQMSGFQNGPPSSVGILSGLKNNTGLMAYGLKGEGSVSLDTQYKTSDGYIAISGNGIPGVEVETWQGSQIVSGVKTLDGFSGIGFYGLEGEGTVTLVDDGLAQFGTYRISGSNQMSGFQNGPPSTQGILSGLKNNTGLMAYGLKGEGTVSLGTAYKTSDGYISISGGGMSGFLNGDSDPAAEGILSGLKNNTGLVAYGLKGEGTVSLDTQYKNSDGYIAISGGGNSGLFNLDDFDSNVIGIGSGIKNDTGIWLYGLNPGSNITFNTDDKDTYGYITISAAGGGGGGGAGGVWSGSDPENNDNIYYTGTGGEYGSVSAHVGIGDTYPAHHLSVSGSGFFSSGIVLGTGTTTGFLVTNSGIVAIGHILGGEDTLDPASGVLQVSGMPAYNKAAHFWGDVHVEGTFTASVGKGFLIDHPTQPGHTLRYGNLEGPEYGAYERGTLVNTNTITLPEYWPQLIDQSTVTVQLTPHGSPQSLYVKSLGDREIMIASAFEEPINCHYIVHGERHDVPKMITVEPR